MNNHTYTPHLIKIVQEVSKHEILPYFRHFNLDESQAKTDLSDLVTDIDISCENEIFSKLKNQYPSALCVGEESIYKQPNLLEQAYNAPLTFMVDPIDGTWNFAHGLATFGIIISVFEYGEIIAGLLYDPIANDWVAGEKGKGAFFGNNEKTARKLINKKQYENKKMHGCVHLNQFSSSQQQALVKQFDHYNRISIIGSSCHEYRLMALGYLDFIIASQAKPWDHAAGCLIIRECGGQAYMNKREIYSHKNTTSPLIICAQPDLQITFLDMLD